MDTGAILGLLGILAAVAVAGWQLYLRIRLVKWLVKCIFGSGR